MGVTHRYQPFPKPECTTTVEEMNAKLQARVKVAQANPKTPVDKKLIEAGHLTPAERLDLSTGEIRGTDETAKINTVAAAAKPLQWDKPKSKDATGLYTTCKRYSCAKVTVNGKTSYELFKLAPGGGWFRSLNAGLDNFLQVQKLAQIDADKGTP